MRVHHRGSVESGEIKEGFLEEVTDDEALTLLTHVTSVEEPFLMATQGCFLSPFLS